MLSSKIEDVKDLSTITYPSVNQNDEGSGGITAREIVQKTLNLKPQKIQITENDLQDSPSISPKPLTEKPQPPQTKNYSEIMSAKQKVLNPIRFRKQSVGQNNGMTPEKG